MAAFRLNKDGTFKEVEIYGKQYKGKALYDILDNLCPQGVCRGR